MERWVRRARTSRWQPWVDHCPAFFRIELFRTLKETSSVGPLPVGDVRIEKREGSGHAGTARQRCIPGPGLLVYPYMPIHYFLTQGKNPTEFFFLQPGHGEPNARDRGAGGATGAAA